MNKRYQRLLAAVSAAALTLLTACGGGTGTSQSSDIPKVEVAMGRYVEKTCELPGQDPIIAGLQRDGGGLELFSLANGGWQRYTSADGLAWTPEEGTLEEQSGLNQIANMARKPDGGLLVAGQFYDEEFQAQLDAFYASGGGYTEDLTYPPMRFVEIAPDGSVKELPITLPPNAFGNVSQLAVAESGEIIVSGYNEAYQFDPISGALKNTYSLEAFADSIAVSGSTLVTMAGGVARLFDLATGDQLEVLDQLGLVLPAEGTNVSMSNDHTLVAAAAVGEDGSFYFCNSSGIYRRAAEGNLPERLVDGSLVSLGTPSCFPVRMAVWSDGILVVLRNDADNQFLLKKYVYDPSVPTLPDKELRIYSLQENKTVRQAIGLYQTEHPDTHVVLETAPADLANSDALRALNTQLLAGKGPDILVLDGMPVDSYIEKKVLAPLDEAIAQEMLPNLAAAGRGAEGKRYTVPARFALPVMTGDAEALSKVTDAAALADAAAALYEKNPDKARVLQNCGGGQLLNTLYPLFEPSLYLGGKLDEAKLRTFLEDLKRIIDLQSENQFVTEAGEGAVLDITWSSVGIALGQEVMGLGYVKSPLDFSVAAFVNTLPGGTMLPFPADSRVYIPSALLGVNSAGPNGEIAQDFIRTVLSNEVQSLDFADGLPVNSQALAQLWVPKIEENNHVMSFGVTGEDGETDVVSVRYPPEETLKQLKGWVEALDTPLGSSVTVLELLRKETADYFVGAKTLDATVTAVTQKLLLLEAE